MKLTLCSGLVFCWEYDVSGCGESIVYFYDLARPKNSCVNKLQVCLVSLYFLHLKIWLQVEVLMKPFTSLKGHGSPVMGVAWNHGENLLSSSDSDGTVFVWKRAKTN